jgi:hypothetical protein
MPKIDDITIDTIVKAFDGIFLRRVMEVVEKAYNQSAYSHVIHHKGGKMFRSIFGSKPLDPDDITTYPSTTDILRSGKFSAEERKQEYRRRGKSPSGVIDGVYNDSYLEPGHIYNDFDRDWEADA